MKPIMIIAMVFFSISLQAANDRKESVLIKCTRSTIASEDKLEMNNWLAKLAHFPKESDLSKAMHLLLEAEIDPNVVVDFSDGLNYTALSRAAIELAEPNIHILREWSENHEDAIDPNAGGSYTPLTAALGSSMDDDRTPVILALLQFNTIDINRTDSKGNTPLFAALEKVLQFNSTIWKGDPMGAVFTGYLSSAELLVQHGAYVTEELLLQVDTALEQKEITHNQYDRIMEVLSSGRSTKSASSKG